MAYTTIDDPSAHFQTKIYTGNGGALAVTNPVSVPSVSAELDLNAF